ncbi:hypothetical protein [Paenibacillus alkalitolerans]|uniref:hypothetical protein n=1 Tax=Paenibacillus alkalitolerans TaxID=2799335 RepID=UPI0018F2949F|nr:hypothetical protein [Paenibacillus alkalitolerans]
MSITLQMLGMEDLQDPMKIEAYSEQLLETAEDGSSRLKPDASKELSFLFQNKWIGFPSYAQSYARDWLNTETIVNQLSEDLDKVKTLEEATEAAMTHLRRWGRQAAADIVGAFCFLEAQAAAAGGNDGIIARIRTAERSYAGYLAQHEQELEGDPSSGLQPGQSLYIAQPLFSMAPGYMEWLFGVVDVALLNRRPLIQDALIAESFEQVLLKVMLASNGVIEEAALLGAYVAYLLDLKQHYSLSNTSM